MSFNHRVLLVFALTSANFLGGAVFAAAKLPTVDVGRGSVSARALFGEPLTENQETRDKRQETSNQSVVISKPAPVPVKNSQTASVDVLVPMRPNGDLWARASNDKRDVVARSAQPAQKLRIPDASEFKTFDNDFSLPEESLDFAFGDMQESRRPDGGLFAGVRGGTVPRVKRQNSAAPVRAAPSQASHDDEDASQLRQQQNVPPSKKSGPVIQNRFAPAPRAAVDTRGEVFVRKVVVPMGEERESGVGNRESWNDFDNDTYSSAHKEKGTDRNFARTSTTSDSRLPTPDDDDIPLTKMSPMQLKRAFQKTYISENKHLSTYKIDDRFDVASDVDYQIQGFDSSTDFAERGGIRPLEIRLGFRGTDSSLSRDNFNLLSEYAGIVVSNPKRAIQVSIPESSTRSFDGRRLAARRLAIIEQVLKDAGVSDQRIMPVLSQRNDNSFVLRVISNDTFQTLSEQQRDMFGDTIKSKTYKSLSW